MRIQDIVAMGKEYLMHGEKRISWKKLIWKLLFVIYLIVVIGLTLLGRFGGWENKIIKPLFYSYKEAWYSGKVTEWSNLVLNICMFVPFGFLVSLAVPKINRFWKTYLQFIVKIFFKRDNQVAGWKKSNGTRNTFQSLYSKSETGKWKD